MMATGKKDLRYVHRGDPTVKDFTKTDFIQDNVWHDLDLSGVIPNKTVLVVLSLTVAEPSGFKWVYFKKKGVTNDVNMSTTLTQVANVIFATDLVVAPDDNRVIQYRVASVSWTYINVVIRGWFT